MPDGRAQAVNNKGWHAMCSFRSMRTDINLLTMINQRIASIKALSAAAAIIFAVGLHPASANAQAGGAPTDPQIVGIVEAADQIDIDYAKLAESKAKHKEVKDFARQMITDHSAVQKAVRELA